MATATGLGQPATIRLFEAPHTGPNYLTREMVHVVGRKHARRLRTIAVVVGAVLPILILVAVASMQAASLWTIPAFVLFMAGLFAERWLFFAEAEHAVSLYYGRPAGAD
jgi:DMSO reductase anchor subunit